MGIFNWFRKPNANNEKINRAIIPEIKISITQISPSSESVPRLKLISHSKDTLANLRLENIGNPDPICPYCGKLLKKKPLRKMKCPGCSNYIYIRTRPSDREKVLVTGSQVLLIEEQQAEQSAINYGYHDKYLEEKKEFETEKDRMAKIYGSEPSYADVKLSICRKELEVHVNQNKWGLYRNAKFKMAETLKWENKLEEALSLYLEICYLDINGPSNIGPVLSDSKFLKEYPPFNPKYGLFAPGILNRIVIINRELKLNDSEIKEIFFNAAKPQQNALALPISTENAWTMLESELRFDNSNIDRNL